MTKTIFSNYCFPILALEKEVENQARQLGELQDQITQKNRQLQNLMVKYNGCLISQDKLVTTNNENKLTTIVTAY